MIINPDDYKNYIIVMSDDPIEIVLPTPKTPSGSTFEVKGQVTITQPSPTSSSNQNPGLTLSRSFTAMGEEG